ncbi:MAG: NUDIX domain-containing protein [Streptosporangiales bacterium]|nr:NUDIX domain-containing protein [Streptosporangiales bacterium]
MGADIDGVRRVRVAAYAIVIRDGHVLLARFVDRFDKKWTLPGGGLDHGEDPVDAVLREVTEETGYECAVDQLLGVDSLRVTEEQPPLDVHAVRIYYATHIVGGELRHEVGGSTDRAEWFELTAVPELNRGSLVDQGLRLHQERPAVGRAKVAP